MARQAGVGVLCQIVTAFLQPFQCTCCGLSWQVGPQTLSRTFGGMVAKFALAQWVKRDSWFVTDHLQAPKELPRWSTELQGQKAGLDIEGLAPGEPLLSLS